MPRRLLLFAMVLAACRQREAAKPEITAPNAPVILISIDTLRADHLPAYGYRGVETPHIDALRKDSILFSSAWSHVPLTLPSHVSILTGLLPPEHGVRNNLGFVLDTAKHPTIGSILKRKGYATGAAVSAYVLRGTTGLAGAFDFYDDDIVVREAEVVGRLQRPGAETEAVAERWIAARARKPFFFMLHLFEPHTPYAPPEPFASRYASKYDGEIATADAIVGKYLDFLKREGIYDRALIILLSDHGEGLGEHGEDEHGIFLYREAIHVPLIMKMPQSQFAGRTEVTPVPLTDVLPTVAVVTGATAQTRGRSLLDVRSAPAQRIYSESLYPRIHLGWSDLRSLVDDRFHFIDAPRPELYAISDSAERTNIVSEQRRILASMRKDLEPFSRQMPAIGNIDPEEAKKLAALGYLSSTTSDTSGPLPDPKDGMIELTMMKEATALEQAGRLNDAVAKYRQLVERNPRLTDAWTMLGRLLEQTGRLREAAGTYKRTIQLTPSLAGEMSLSLANVYLMLNRPDDAASHAQLGLQTNPGNARILLGRAALAKNDLSVAAAEADAAMRAHGYEAAAAVLQAQIFVKQRRLQDAMAAILSAERHARARDVTVPLLHFVRGDILMRMNRLDEAITAFNEEIRLYPHDRQAYASLAVIYVLAGRRDRANATMDRLVAANPSPDSYELAAQTFAEVGDRQSAAAWRRRAPTR